MDGAVVVLPNEQALIARAVAEPAAFAALYDHYFGRVYNYVRYRVQDAQTTDDLVARIFEKALAHLGEYAPQRAPFAVWLFTIARNTVNDHLRAHGRRHWLSLDILAERASADPQPEEAILHKETQAALLDAIGRLKDRERDLIAFKFAAGLTNRRIAELTGFSENHVAVILYRAIRRLRDHLTSPEALYG